MSNRTKIKKTYNIIIRLAIVFLTYGYIYKEVFFRTDYAGILAALRSAFTEPYNIILLGLVILLMPLNWVLESGKWRFLVSKIEKIGFVTAFEAVLSGVSVSTFTPNRIGEYFGRVYILRYASRIEGILVTILGSMSQLLVTLLTGSVALLLFIPTYMPFGGRVSGYIYFVVLAGLVLVNFFLVTVYFNIFELRILKSRIPRERLKYLRRFFRVINLYNRRELMIVFIYSAARYLVFSTQFYILLRVFSLPVNYLPAMMIISIIYFTMAIIPTVGLTELGIRGSVAIYFFGILLGLSGSDSDPFLFSIFAASTLLWIINLALPALAGSIFVLKLQFFRLSEKPEES